MTKQELRDFFDKVPIDEDMIPKFEQDCIMAEDGYYVFWPTKGNGGYFTEYNLLVLAAYLNKKNREWDDGVDELFR